MKKLSGFLCSRLGQYTLVSLPLAVAMGTVALSGCGGSSSSSNSDGLPGSRASMEQVSRGRALVTTSGSVIVTVDI